MSAASKLLRYGKEILEISLCLAALACQSSPSPKMQPDSSASADKAKVTRDTVDGMNLTMVDVSGTYIAPVMP